MQCYQGCQGSLGCQGLSRISGLSGSLVVRVVEDFRVVFGSLVLLVCQGLFVMKQINFVKNLNAVVWTSRRQTAAAADNAKLEQPWHKRSKQSRRQITGEADNRSRTTPKLRQHEVDKQWNTAQQTTPKACNLNLPKFFSTYSKVGYFDS